MTTIKSYTDLEQSKKLAEILPIESADMNWHELPSIELFVRAFPYKHDNGATDGIFPCWSLAALFNILPKEIVYDKNIVYLEFHVWENSLEYVNNADYILHITRSYDNPIDACYEMIIKLHELNLL